MTCRSPCVPAWSRVSRAQWGGQVDHHAPHPGPRPPDLGDGPGQRQEVRRARCPAGRGRGVARGQGGAHVGSAYNHLRALAATHNIPNWRVNEVIDLVGLRDVAKKRAGGFSLGMGQRLGIVSALLADPEVLMLDEPVNGLDPEGVRWVRELLRSLAAEGRTVFLSSHLMSEMELTANHLIVVGRGRLIADISMDQLTDASKSIRVRVRTPRQRPAAQRVGR